MANGQLDNSFAASSVYGTISALQLLATGKILVGGCWDYFNTTTLHALVRLQPDGQLDPSFSSPIQSAQDSRADQILVQPDGKIVTGGYLGYNVPENEALGLIRVLPDGALDKTFTAVLRALSVFGSPLINSIVLQPDTQILPAIFTKGIIRKQTNGQSDASFNATFGNNFFNASVQNIKLQSDGKILVAGYFSSVNGQPVTGLARLLAPNVLHVVQCPAGRPHPSLARARPLRATPLTRRRCPAAVGATAR
ncbi:hypothetical protein E5J99_02615 [Hymenobacter elongatus]|uniref:Delta-60 repeat domain-containing protein n=2 Tax=Hymenobacter elongatus TaxID=877208 RepID=A0A4Z0PRM1_9BACT|nr:hypothetical protein E5J99_02615 [Hymenobacter elongatus]